jgi:steroid delta-isomerase-like uncharacterized protein
MSTEQNKTLVRNNFAALTDHNLDKVISFCTPDCRFHGWSPQPLDTTGYKMAMTPLLEAFPDSRFSVDDVIAEGDKVVLRHSLSGTHQADFQGVPATGRSVVIGGIAIFRLENEKIAEVWLNADFMGLMIQLGAIPAPGQA